MMKNAITLLGSVADDLYKFLGAISADLTDEEIDEIESLATKDFNRELLEAARDDARAKSIDQAA